MANSRTRTPSGADERVDAAEPTGPLHDGDATRDLERVRRLLLAPEQRDIALLKERLDAMGLTPEDLAEVLPAAIAVRTETDSQLAKALSPTLERAFHESVERNPETITNVIFPVLGPAIRKAIGEAMAGVVNTINRAIEHSLSWQGLKWRWEALRTGESYARIVIKHALVYRVEQVFLIHTETGLVLSHVTGEEVEAQDPDLVSGMLTAIRDFVQDSFHADSSDGLSHFKVGRFTVVVEHGPQALLAAVVAGIPPESLRQDLRDALETVHLRYRTALNEFAGDAEPFGSSALLLQDLTQTVLTTDVTPRRSAMPRLLWGLGFALLAVLLGRFLLTSVTWRRAVEAIESEPGLVVIDSNRGMFRSTITGMRDPLAHDPSTILAEAGIDTSRLEQRWRPYLSIDPAIAIQRARAVLHPPGGVELVIEGDTLRIGGNVTADWAANLLTSPLPPGIGSLDWSELVVEPPASLQSLRDEIEGIRVLFPVGSSQLTPLGNETLGRAADLLNNLARSADPMGLSVEVELVGRADSSGPDQRNAELSQERAEAVRAALADDLSTAVRIRAGGIGTDLPLADVGGVTAAQLNRSVSLLLRFTFGRNPGGAAR